ncbi:hypothetical protein ANN_21257 [Periplaneta americana]|uniref:Uncharacterized protein n=1 Tax=Periplaneta americana TaxID=6978 RepID=A0ABQ8SFI4_PERAM|nr:hypothetical protein ANN_21257 [Periplaneta americana]
MSMAVPPCNRSSSSSPPPPPPPRSGACRSPFSTFVLLRTCVHYLRLYRLINVSSQRLLGTFSPRHLWLPPLQAHILSLFYNCYALLTANFNYSQNWALQFVGVQSPFYSFHTKFYDVFVMVVHCANPTCRPTRNDSETIPSFPYTAVVCKSVSGKSFNGSSNIYSAMVAFAVNGFVEKPQKKPQPGSNTPYHMAPMTACTIQIHEKEIAQMKLRVAPVIISRICDSSWSPNKAARIRYSAW